MAEKDNGGSDGSSRATEHENESLIERAARVLKEASATPARAQSSTSEHGHREVAAKAPPSGAKSHEDTEVGGIGGAPRVVSSKSIVLDAAIAQRNNILLPSEVGSRTAEELRQIKQTLLYSMFYGTGQSAKNTNLVMVTSAQPNEGKTFIATNIAVSISSEKDLNVLLVDLDATNQGITKSLGISVEKGLIDLIDDPSLVFADIILRTNIEGFSIIPSGSPHPFALELFGSERMAGLLDDLSSRYRDRIIIFDAPPVLATADASALAQHMGQIMFVVEAHKTDRATIQEALDLIGHSQNIAFVLNKTRAFLGDTDFGAYYQSYGYGNPS